MSSVVTDAGPIIHLAEIDSLHYMSLFETLFVPKAVWQETVGRERVSAVPLNALPALRRISVPPIECEQLIRQSNLQHLHVGERECLYICHTQGIDTLLTDDLAVRDAAKRMNIRPVGSLGIIVRAYNNQLIKIEEAEALLRKLHERSSLFVTSAVVELALRQLQSTQ